MNKDGFFLREQKGIPYYSCRALESIAGLRHGFSTRMGGAPAGSESSLNLNYMPWDSAERVDANRERYLSALNLHGAQLATLHQVHSNRAYIIEEDYREWNQSEGDALITRIEGVALAVKVADCLPVLVADPVKRAVGAVHSGWRGTLSGVLRKTISEMERVFGTNPSDLVVAVGPGIRSCCYEVGPDVVERFEKDYRGAGLVSASAPGSGKYFLDLVKALDVQLDLAGVPVENRFDLGACTRCNTGTFFSYRAEGAASGRMMAVIALQKPGSAGVPPAEPC
jgi:polyphenol oxidase